MLFIGDAVLQVSTLNFNSWLYFASLNFKLTQINHYAQNSSFVIVQVNGINVENATHEEVVSLTLCYFLLNNFY